MTEVPEHLLKRSRDRRAALGLGGGGGDEGGGDAAPTPAPADEPGGEVATTGATAAARPAAATPAEAAEPAPPEPKPPYVEAALKRKKIPIWVMPVLAFIPVWAIIYIGGLSKANTGQLTQLQVGQQLFAARCASCHGSGGGGGVGRPMTDQALIQTFPDVIGQLHFVWVGSNGIGPAGTPYGDPNRPGGQHKTLGYDGSAMPNFDKSLTQAELLAVVRYERETLSGWKLDPKMINANGDLQYANGKPMLSATGELLTPDGKPLFNSDGSLSIQPNWTTPVGSS